MLQRTFQLFCFGLLLVTGLGVQAATFDITTTEDVSGDDPLADGQCSLRDALMAINTQKAINECPAGTGSDRINLQPGEVYLLEQGPDIDIGQQVAGLQVGGLRRIHVNEDGEFVDEEGEVVENEGDAASTPVNPRVTVQAASVTLEEDEDEPAQPEIRVVAGSAALPGRVFDVRSAATLTLEGVTLSGGDVTGAGAGGTSSCTEPRFQTRGGLIRSCGELNVRSDVRLLGGTAEYGGAIYIDLGNNLTIEETQLSGNHATQDGGAVYLGDSYSGRINLRNAYIGAEPAEGIDGNSADGAGAGIFIQGNTVTLNAINVTFTQNTANSGGVALHVGSIGNQRLLLNNLTFADNRSTGAGAGFYLEQSAASDALTNSVLVGTHDGAGGDLDNCAGPGIASLYAAYVVSRNCVAAGLNNQKEAAPQNTGQSDNADMSVLMTWNDVDGQAEACPGAPPCDPVPAEFLDDVRPGYLPNFAPISPSLLDSGSGETEVEDVCDSFDQRAVARQDRCDVGAVEFRRAEGEVDSFEMNKGGTELLDVVVNDLGDTRIDCNLLGDPATCIVLAQPSTRNVTIITQVDPDTGYPLLEYTQLQSFDGQDFFSYRVNKDAFVGSTFSDNDVGARVALRSRPANGFTKSENIDDLGGAAGGVPGLILLFAGLMRRRARGPVVALLGLLVLLPMSAQAREIIVNSVDDNLNNQPGLCTLRGAIDAAQDKLPPLTGCSPGETGTDTIILDAEPDPGDASCPVDATCYVLDDSLEIGLGNRVVIEGNGVGRTYIRGDGTFRLIQAQSTISLRNLTLEGGNADSDAGFNRGGAILARRGLGLENVRVLNNRAERGGAIFLDFNDDERRTVDIRRAYFSGNDASPNGAPDPVQQYAGGVLSMFGQTQRHTITIEDTTFHDNSATDQGGAIDLVLGASSRVDIVNTTFYENVSGVGGSALDIQQMAETASVNIVNGTFLDNTGGTGSIDLGNGNGNVLLSNSIYADVNCSSGGSRFNNSYYNLLSGPPAGNCSPVSSNSDVGNDYNEPAANIDNALNEEAEQVDNDELTFVPLHLSIDENEPASGLMIDSGNPADLSTGTNAPLSCRREDVRGEPRAAGADCDRGAFELQVPTAVDDSGSNNARRSRTVLLDTLANDIAGDGLEIMTGSISLSPIIGDPDPDIEDTAGAAFVRIRERELEAGEDPDEVDLRERYDFSSADEVHYLDKIYDQVGPDPVYSCGNGDNLLGPDTPGGVAGSNTGDIDDDCVVVYVAPPIECDDLPFTDRFDYSFVAAEGVDGGGNPINPSAPVSGRVTVTINNVAPRVHSGFRTFKMDPGGSLVIPMPDDVYFDIDALPDGVSGSYEESSENLEYVSGGGGLPLFTRRGVDPDDASKPVILGIGLILDEDNQTITYHHNSTFQEFRDEFIIQMTDECGDNTQARFRVEFPTFAGSGGDLLGDGIGPLPGSGSMSWWHLGGLVLLVWRRRGRHLA